VEENFYSVDETPRTLKLAPGRIRQVSAPADSKASHQKKAAAVAGRSPCTSSTIAIAPPAREVPELGTSVHPTEPTHGRPRVSQTYTAHRTNPCPPEWYES
jgi:hypothetical protein